MFIRRLLAVSLMAVACSSAQAALVRIDFTGTNSSPDAVNVFGTPISQLTGYIVYDDAVAGATFSSTATNYSGAIRELSFSVGAGGSSVFSGLLSGGSHGYAQVLDAAGSDRLSFNNLTLSASQLQGEVANVSNGTALRTFNNAQLTLGLSGDPTTIGNQMLAGIDPTLFTTQRNLQLFLSYTTQPGGTTTGAWPAVNYNYNLQSVSVSQVPLPAGAWLLGSGLLSLVGMARRRRAVAA